MAGCSLLFSQAVVRVWFTYAVLSGNIFKLAFETWNYILACEERRACKYQIFQLDLNGDQAGDLASIYHSHAMVSIIE